MGKFYVAIKSKFAEFVSYRQVQIKAEWYFCQRKSGFMLLVLCGR